MTDNPLISVVIPTFNYGRFIGTTIESVAGQTCSDLEILVVDDASSDDTASVVRSLRDDRIRYIRHDVNKGPSAARNTGLQRASGSFVTCIDSDDAMKPRNLEVKTRVLQDSPGVDIVFGNVEVIDEAGTPLGVGNRRQQDEVLPQPVLLRRLLRGNPFHASATVVRRHVYDVAGTYREDLRHAEDWDLWLRMACFFSARYVGEPLVRHRLHPHSLRNANVEAHLDLSAMESIFERLFDQHPAQLQGYDRRSTYWANYFTILHSKAGVLRSSEVLRLYGRGLRSYPRRLVRWEDVKLLGKIFMYAAAPASLHGTLRGWYRKRKYGGRR
ncbi:MAG TPA: glycosyltransferase [Actinomycetota bacterium]|nr:glycosyltransferase [Actinomycetota bacterium]